MLRPDTQKWNQTLDDLRGLSLESAYKRTRERFLALFQIASGLVNAKQWAQATRRRHQTVLQWIHDYNHHGPDALSYRRTGGHRPFLS